MPRAASKQAPAAAQSGAPQAVAGRKPNLPVFLVTADDMLWPQVGAELAGPYALSQHDGIDELLATTPAGTPAVVLWDARAQSSVVQALSRIQLHSTCFAIVVLDEPSNAGLWTLSLQHRHVMAHVGIPLAGAALGRAIDAASEEVQARAALLNESVPAAAASPPTSRRRPLAALMFGAAALAAGAAWFLSRHGAEEAHVAAVARAPSAPTPDSNQDKLDGLVEKAQQAMADRHFIDPVAGSALSLYRDALLVDPSNGEARQGLERLAEILVARIQTALDERKFDVALQALETARSINSGDARLPAFDERIAALRAELGPAQIMAAINAQNFDRALQLIDEATRARSLPVARLAALREEVRKRRDDADRTRLLKLVDTRLQQDHLVEPRNDSAAFYLEQARQAGVASNELQAPTQDLQRRVAQDVHTAIEQRRFADAEHGLADLRDVLAPQGTVAGLQHELTVGRGGTSQARAETPQPADLMQQRLAQGQLSEPENDSAFFYLNQLRASDPRNASLAALTVQLQSQLLERARAAFEGGDLSRTELSLQQAQSLGPSADADALATRLRARRTAEQGRQQLPEQTLSRLAKLEITYPSRAEQAGVEGWVEIGYLVQPDGSVAGIRVLSASPAGAFEQAATKAVSKLRYQPVIRDGRPVAVSTQMRVLFRLPK